MEIAFKNSNETLKHVFQAINIDAVCTVSLPKKRIVKILRYFKRYGQQRIFQVKYDCSLVNFASSLAFSYNPIIFCTIDEFKYNLSGCAHSLMNQIPLIIAVLLPNGDMENFANNLGTTVCKSIFNISTCQEIIQVFIAATVVARSRKGGSGPVMITIQEEVFKSHASIINAIQNPVFNEDLDLINTPLDRKCFYSPLNAAIKRCLVVNKEPCKWLDGLFASYTKNMNVYIDFSSYILFGSQILGAAKKYGSNVNIPSRLNDDTGCIPRAVGMAMALKNQLATETNGALFPIVVVITIESLLRSILELKICIKNCLPLMIIIMRKSNYCPILNVGLCGSLFEMQRILGLQENIHVISKHSSPNDISKHLKQLKYNPTLMMFDATQALHYPTSIYDTRVRLKTAKSSFDILCPDTRLLPLFPLFLCILLDLNDLGTFLLLLLSGAELKALLVDKSF